MIFLLLFIVNFGTGSVIQKSSSYFRSLLLKIYTLNPVKKVSCITVSVGVHSLSIPSMICSKPYFFDYFFRQFLHPLLHYQLILPLVSLFKLNHSATLISVFIFSKSFVFTLRVPRARPHGDVFYYN